MPGITIYRVEDGKIAEAWSCCDERGLLEQLGVAFDVEDSEYEDLGPETGFGMII